MSRTIPYKDSDFNEFQEVIYAAAEQHAMQWSIDSEWFLGSFVPARAVWIEKWAACQNPATRSPALVFEKNQARKNYEHLLRTLIGMLEYNPKVTDADRRLMGIPIPGEGGSAIPPPQTYPDFTIDSSVIRQLSLHFRDHNSSTRAKPHGVYGAVIRWAILDSPPADINTLTNSDVDTHSPYTFNFTEPQRGKTVYFCLAWQNSKGIKGPWSEIISGIIP